MIVSVSQAHKNAHKYTKYTRTPQERAILTLLYACQYAYTRNKSNTYTVKRMPTNRYIARSNSLDGQQNSSIRLYVCPSFSHSLAYTRVLRISLRLTFTSALLWCGVLCCALLCIPWNQMFNNTLTNLVRIRVSR